ncbi:histidine--tRNA ligase [Parasphaerochaeta coccoides]|uniref:Histidine--tRNA ligase n=1 Tax=Parasphaerochaeta coccoides (strain ATCC BAA-1237 / DSM 17374 / SPN1) TaxID=760011 RepID=F4GJB6_PARC1|nr:histidine--tRNA ligase [Parasphaerochaeta coccoides]AEC01756.1 histidyl-tRNA synthetase [Parasphaerochaeta coccoides DSM 17374]
MPIEPKILKGFRDSLPAQEIVKKRIISRLEHVFSTFGFVPIDTPALEYTEVLLGKGGGETDKQIFRFTDNGGRDVAMRFDLTVPFARFLAAHAHEIALPFKRFHIDKVWRGENPQKGRFREFTQCDFDIVGVDNAWADFEILSIMNESFTAMGIDKVTFHVAHRGLFNAFLAHLGIQDHSVDVLRTVDKLRKIGSEATREELEVLTGSSEKANAVLSYISPAAGTDFLERLENLSSLAGGEQEHSGRLREIYHLLSDAGIASKFELDPSITRGLDYYTGIVYETFLDDLQTIGSVCSGGRYNDLASMYSPERIPGVGSSIGLDRLMSGLAELDSPLMTDTASAHVLVMVVDEKYRTRCIALSRLLRSSGLAVDVYVASKKAGQQYKYAESGHIPYAVIAEDGEKWTVKNLATRETVDGLTDTQVCEHLTKENA